MTGPTDSTAGSSLFASAPRTRVLILFACALVALCGSIAAALATADLRDFDLRGYVDATQDADLPYRVARLGVNADLMQADDIPAQLTLMAAARITWVRQIFAWDEIETAPGAYDWARADAVVNAFAARDDLALVAVLVNSPQWARAERATDADPALLRTAPPTDPADFGAFAAAFAARYGHSIAVYQVWDEPNLFTQWGGADPQAADYAALLQSAYTAIHSADSGATVLMAALAPTTEHGPRNISDWDYLSDLYAMGANAWFDAAAAKPYGFDLPPDDRTVDGAVLNFSRVVGLREIMVAHGDGHKALWGSQFGWNALPETWRGAPSIWGSVTASEQARYTLAALARAEREWPWLGGLILQRWQPHTAPDDPQWGFALRTPDGHATPLYDALAARAVPDAASNGLFHPANAFARYSGVWTFGPLGADIGWLRDSRLTFDFTGSSVALLLREDDYVAHLYLTVDDRPANALPQDNAGNTYIVLTSGTRRPELNLVLVAANLRDGRHTLRATADEGEDRWALAGYAVSSGDLRAPYNRQISIAWLTSALAFAALVALGTQVRWRRLFAPVAGVWRGLGSLSQLAITALTSLALMLGTLLTLGDVFRREPVLLVVSVMTAGILYINPLIYITLAAAGVLFVIFYNRPLYGLMLAAFYAPFFLFPVELYRYAFPMVELVTLITCAAWALRLLAAWGSLRRADVRPAWSWRAVTALDWGVMAWVGLGALSLLWAEILPRAVTELRALLLEPALFYLMLRTLRPTRADLLRLVDALLLAGVVVAAVGLVLYLRGEAIITAEESARRLASVYGSPNNVALFLGRCLPFALAFALLPLDRTRRIAAGAALAVMLIAAALTQSVGGLFIGIPAGLAAVLLLAFGRRAVLPLAVVALAALAAFVVGASVSERFARALEFSEGTNFYRLRVWESALEVIQDHPFTGLGLDQFLYAFRGAYIRPDAWPEPDLSHPHNILLDFWVRLGVGGAALLLVLLAAFWRRVFAALHAAQDPLARALVVGTAGAMANVLAHGLVDNSVFVVDLAFVFVLLLALAADLARAPGSIPANAQQGVPTPH